MKKIIYLGHQEKSITGGHKYNDAFEAYLKKISGIEGQYTPSCSQKYRGLKKFISPFVELKYLKSFNKDTLVFFGDTLYKHHFLLAFFTKYLTQAKSAMIVHHFPFVEQTGLLWMINKWLMCKYTTMIDNIVVPSPLTLDVAKRLFPQKKVFYVPLPFDKKFKKSDNYEKGNLLYVGTIEERKGLSFLVEAISLLDNKDDVKLNIVGKVVEQSYYKRLQAQIAMLGLTHNIRFLGRVSDETLNECYQKAEIFTFPSLLEGYGIVLIEAFNNGLPIICFNNTAMPYTVRDGVNGYIANNKDSKDMAKKIKQLMGNPSLRNQLQEGIKETVMHMKTLDDFHRGIDLFYKDVCSR